MEDIYVTAEQIRRLSKRVDDLEHDNNVLRTRYAELATANANLSLAFEQVGEKCERLVRTVNQFVARFTVVQ